MEDRGTDDFLPMTPTVFAIFREKCRAEGQHDALVFAMECQGDVGVIEAEIEDHLDLISSGTGSSAPGASPRIYQDAYIAGLRLALEIIQRNTSDETTD